MREWLTVIIVLLIVGIILDGIRRVRAARRERIHMSNSLPEEGGFDDENVGSEFPSGGARVAAYRHPEDAANLHVNLKSSLAASKKTAGVNAKAEPAPTMLMDSADEHLEPTLGNLDDLDDDVAVMAPPRTAAPVAKAPAKEAAAQPKAKVAEPALEPEEVIVINVMAHQGQLFGGETLLQTLTEQNLRFGNMEIFHRHKNEDGSGEVLFSLANIVKPGTFDLTTMDDFSTPGISMFMMLPIRGDSVAAFGLMARTAKAISEALDGELKDEHRSVMTQQTFEHCRQRVIEFERKRRLNR